MKNINIGIGLNADWINGDDEKFRHCLNLAKASGGNSCEIIAHSMDVFANGKILKSRLNDVKKVLSEFDFNYTMHMPYSFDPHKGYINENIAFFKECINFAREINISCITVHSSEINIYDEDELIKNVNIYKEIGEFAENIQIGIENIYYPKEPKECRDYLGVNPKVLKNHIQNINMKNVGITLDFGHLFLCSNMFGTSFISSVNEMLPYTVHTHIHDNFGKNGKMTNYMDNLYKGIGDLHLPPLWGNLPWNDVSTFLKQLDVTFILETEFRFYPYFKDAVDFIRRLV